jgi:hypothetical protein
MDQAEEPKPKSKTPRIIFTILFLISLGLNFFLFFNYARKAIQLEKDNEELADLLDISELKADSLEQELNSAIAMLQSKLEESYFQESELQKEREELLVELERKRVQISRLIAQGGGDGSSGGISLAKAKKEIEELKSSNNRFISELEELKKVYAIAQDAADRFSGKVSYYQGTNDSLKNANGDLERKLTDLAVLQITDLSVIGQKTKRDELVGTFKASKVESLRISFTVLASDAIRPGKKKIDIRIIGTSGEVLLDNLDSLRSSEDLVSMHYTISYDGDEQRINISYTQEAKFKEGDHKLQILQDGKLIDQLRFELL